MKELSSAQVKDLRAMTRTPGWKLCTSIWEQKRDLNQLLLNRTARDWKKTEAEKSALMNTLSTQMEMFDSLTNTPLDYIKGLAQLEKQEKEQEKDADEVEEPVADAVGEGKEG